MMKVNMKIVKSIVGGLSAVGTVAGIAMSMIEGKESEKEKAALLKRISDLEATLKK